MYAGGIYAARKHANHSKQDDGTMFEKLSLLGRKPLLETLPNILNGQNRKSLQDGYEPTFLNTTHATRGLPTASKLQRNRQLEYAACVLGRLSFTTYEGKRFAEIIIG